jgi:hypothetical protein
VDTGVLSGDTGQIQTRAKSFVSVPNHTMHSKRFDDANELAFTCATVHRFIARVMAPVVFLNRGGGLLHFSILALLAVACSSKRSEVTWWCLRPVDARFHANCTVNLQSWFCCCCSGSMGLKRLLCGTRGAAHGSVGALVVMCDASSCSKHHSILTYTLFRLCATCSVHACSCGALRAEMLA